MKVVDLIRKTKMNELELIELKKVAGEALSEMIDKMVNETDFNDTVLTVSIAGHDIKGYDISLNQYSTEITIGQFITASISKFIRYPEYFGVANIEKLHKANKDQKRKYEEFSEKDAIKRAEERPSDIFNTLDPGIRILEATGFSSQNIVRVLQHVENADDVYNPREEPNNSDGSTNE